MQKFKYTAVNLQKQKIKGIFIADDEHDLATQLARQSLYLIKATPYNDMPSAFFTLGTGKVSTNELTSFCRQFAIMQNSHIPILDCLDLLRNQHYSGYFRSILNVIYDDVKSGVVLSAALDKRAKVFPDFFRSMIHVGEMSGKLDVVLSALADYYEKDANIKRKFKSAMSYPIMLMGMTAAIVILMLAVVVPTFREAMDDLNVNPAGITKAVYDISEFVLNYWRILLIGIVLFGTALFVVLRTEKGKYVFDVLKLKVPVIRTVQQNMITARFARAFGLLLSSGMDMNAAMSSVEIIIGNRYLKQKFRDAADSVRHGMSLTMAFEAYKLFPALMIQMVTIGEKTATIDEALLSSCDFFDAQVEESLTAMTSKLQPIMLATMGGIIGTLFIAVYSPMLDIMSTL